MSSLSVVVVSPSLRSSSCRKGTEPCPRTKPGDIKALDYHSSLLEIGRTNKAIAERILEHDPLRVIPNAELGLYLLQAGRADEAIARLQKALDRTTQSHWVQPVHASIVFVLTHVESSVNCNKTAFAGDYSPRSEAGRALGERKCGSTASPNRRACCSRSSPHSSSMMWVQPAWR